MMGDVLADGSLIYTWREVHKPVSARPMKWITAISIGITLIYSTLTFLNPTLIEYQGAILAPLAEEEAERLAAADRRVVEQEAARLSSQFTAVHYDSRKLDAAWILKHHPILGASFVHQAGSEGKTLTENLLIAKRQALRRIETTRETIRYGLLVDLTAHSNRRSHGTWSEFSTCLKTLALSYTGLAGQFYAKSEHACETTDASH